MSTTRKIAAVFGVVAAGMLLLGITDSKLTELMYVFWIPAVIALALRVFSSNEGPAVPSQPGDWKRPGADAQWQARMKVLGDGHAFTPEQLEANRSGALHPAQLAKGRRRGAVDVRFGKVLLGVSAVAFIAGQALPFFPEAIKNADFTPAMPKSLAVGVFVGLFVWFLLGLLPLMFGWGALKHGRGVVAAYEAGKAAVVEGPLRKLEVRRRRSGSSYYYLVGDLQLWVVNGGWNTVQHEGKYRVYYVPGRFEVLSLELV